MGSHHFISYSTSDADGESFALTLHDALLGGPPSVPVWVDKRRLRPGEDWDSQIVEAILTCDTMRLTSTAPETRLRCGDGS